jgi:hypothetical protein
MAGHSTSGTQLIVRNLLLTSLCPLKSTILHLSEAESEHESEEVIGYSYPASHLLYETTGDSLNLQWCQDNTVMKETEQHANKAAYAASLIFTGTRSKFTQSFILADHIQSCTLPYTVLSTGVLACGRLFS